MSKTSERLLILASQSPRRKELIEMLNIPFEVQASEASEEVNADYDDFSNYVEELALKKAMVVFQKHQDTVVIGADTIVTFNGKVYSKPENEAQAIAFLRELSGNTHTVYTGVAIVFDEQTYVFSVATDVTFWELDDEMIQAYVASGDPLDKAGAYGIQTAGALFVKEIKGDYYSVVGLPVSALYKHLTELGIIAQKERQIE